MSQPSSLHVSPPDPPPGRPPNPAPGAHRSPADLRAAAAHALAQRLSPKYWEEHCLLPLELTDTELIVAAGAEVDATVVDELCWVYDRRVTLVPAPAAEIHGAILSAQSTTGPDLEAADARGSDLVVLAPEDDALDDIRALANQAPVIKLVNLMILEALRARASDIHLETLPDGLRVRYRIDGV
ncbi:MAG TPA: hypothetical protein VE091_14700, partial [Gemmatimonadales bacterium]|nr:hypothetical protein [Gemmatimonadales bacterium]